MKLNYLTDKCLHSEILNLVLGERGSTAKILYHLIEIDRRKLYSDYKCTSLFDYCVRLLNYSDASAQRRIVAARLLADLPEIGPKIESGILGLTNISQANQFFRENKIINNDEKRSILKKIEHLSKKECEKKLFEIFGVKKEIVESQKRIGSNTSQLTLILSDETLAEVEKLKSLLGKNLSMDGLIHYMAKAAIEKVEKQKFKQVKNPRSLPLATVKRTPGAAIKREIYLRDRSCTQCGSLHHLNYDHREAFALGGATTEENMRLLCFNCNQRARIKVFGTTGNKLKMKEARPPPQESQQDWA